jgi:hypothetical protein
LTQLPNEIVLQAGYNIIRIQEMKIHKLLLICALVGTTGIILSVYHFGHNDRKALIEFSAAYKNYDRAIADLSNAVFTTNLEDLNTINDLKGNATAALAELDLKAQVRISSLTKNDAEIMSLTQEIADLSGKEVDTLKAYRLAISNKDAALDTLGKKFHDLTIKRQAAYARFQELSGY